jgi:hypothetical protein
MNPTAPTLHATIKLHKPNKPIRPIINWKPAPAYDITKAAASVEKNWIEGEKNHLKMAAWSRNM